MKKWLIIILVSAGAIFIIGSIIYSKNHEELYNPYTGSTTTKDPSLCAMSGCNKPKLGYSDYCRDHTCQEPGCNDSKNEDAKYCYEHERKKIVYSESDLEEASRLVYEYRVTLIAENKKVLDIRDLDLKSPYVNEDIVSYSCTLVTNNSTERARICLTKIYESDKLFILDLQYYDNDNGEWENFHSLTSKFR